MSLALSSIGFEQPGPSATGISGAGLLSRLIYRSRAVHPMSALELYRLALAAQSRNRAESVTGLVLYDEGNFFQWLEGPAESLERIVRSISNDPRHTDIVVLDEHAAETRLFADWSMQLAATGRAAGSWRADVIEPAPGIIAELRRNPDAALRLLATLRPVVGKGGIADVRSRSGVPLNRHAAAILKTVVIETVIPALVRRHGVLRGARPLPLNKRVQELADLLVAGDHEAAGELIREVQAETPHSLLPFASLFEPAARRLGDLWSEDVCSEFDVTLGLARIQTAVRLLGRDIVRSPVAGVLGPDVLVVPEPGELHGLGAALDSEVMWNVGWHPRCEYPSDDHALEALVEATWFDVLDLSLSAAFRREHWLPRLTKTISAARHASLNPAIVVVVGGRLFAEHLAVGAQVGADVANTTAVQVDKSIMGHWRKGV